MKRIIAAALAAACLCLGSLSAEAADTTIFVDVPASHQIAVSIGSGGAVIYDGIVHTEGFTAEIPHNAAAAFILRPDSGYAVDRVLLDGADVTSELSGGVLRTKPVTADGTLAVTFNKAEDPLAGPIYTLVGTVRENGALAPGVTLELRSRLQAFVTGADGKFRFDGVDGERHSLTLLREEKAVGYLEFLIRQDKAQAGARVTKLPDGMYQLTVRENIAVLNIAVTMLEDGTVAIERAEPITEQEAEKIYPPATGHVPKTGDTASIWLWLMMCAAALLILLYALRRAVKSQD